MLHKNKISGIFAAGIEIWCNGSTTDFGSVCPGSNPGISTKAMTGCVSSRFFSMVQPVKACFQTGCTILKNEEVSIANLPSLLCSAPAAAEQDVRVKRANPASAAEQDVRAQ